MMFENSRYLNTALYNRGGEIPVLKNRKRYTFPKEECTKYTFTDTDSLSLTIFLIIVSVNNTKSIFTYLDAYYDIFP